MGAQITTNKNELVEVVAEQAGVSKAKASEIIGVILDSITNTLRSGNSVSILGFGSFTVNDRAQRTGRNPQTGEEMIIPAAKKVAFKPGKALKDAVNSGEVVEETV